MKVFYINNMGEIIELGDLKKVREKYSNIAFCTGCYDIMHSGHAYFFKQCKQHADVLVVGVGRDSTLKSLKQGRPIIPEQNRLYLVAALADVDYVVLNDDSILPSKIDFDKIIRELKPDVFVLNDNDSAVEEKKKLCSELGIDLKLVPRDLPEGLIPISTSEIVEKICIKNEHLS